MQDKPSISLSVAVVCYNSPVGQIQNLIHSLLDSIEKLKQQVVLEPVPVYLTDNSKKSTFSMELFRDKKARLAANDTEIILIHGHGNIGYGSGHNLILRKLESEFHLILNPDVVLDIDVFIRGINFLLGNSKVLIASPYAIDESGVKQYLCKSYPSVFTFLIRGFFPEPIKKLFRKRLARFEMHDLSEQVASTDIPIVSGCFMLSRTDKLREEGGFDERYFLYFEDFDLSLRMGRLGKLAYVPSMKIIHGGGHAAGKGLKHLRMFSRSGQRFFNAHGWRLFHQA